MDEFRREMVALLPRLRRLAWAISRNAQDAQDLLQTTVERALEHRAGWQAGTRLDQWMFRIMKNAWIDEVRHRGRWGRLIVAASDYEQVTDEGAETAAAESRLELRLVRREVEKLPEEQRLAVKLVLLGGLSYHEAAAMLEIPEGTLTSRLARGRATLLARYHSRECQ